MTTLHKVALVLALVASCAMLSATAMAGNTKSIYLLEAFNDMGQTANDFHILIGNITVNDLDPNGYCDSNYTRTVFQDSQGLHIDWSNGSTPNGTSGFFGFTIRNTTVPNPVLVSWTRGSTICIQPDVWQGWFSQPGLMQATIYNRSSSLSNVRRTFGWSPNQTTISDLVQMQAPPAAVVLDQSPVAISAGSSLQYTYDNGLNASTYYMYYDFPANQSGYQIKFRNAFTVLPDPGLQFGDNVRVNDHYWYPNSGQGPYVPMLSVNANSTTLDEGFHINSVQISDQDGSAGSGIASVDVWIDSNSNGSVDVGTDTHVGSGVLPSNGDPLQMTLSTPVTVPAGGTVALLVSCTLQNPSPAPNSRYRCSLDNVQAIGITSGQPASISGLGISQGDLVVVSSPINITDAKKLTINPASGMTDYAFVKSKTITADFQTTMGLAYLQGQSSGLGVMVAGVDGMPPVGAVVSLWGRLKLLDNSEVVLIPDNGFVDSIGSVPGPKGMTTKATGGGVIGNQPAVVDDASAPVPTKAKGLNSVGMLVKICGAVTGTGQITIDGTTYDAAWLDDGSGLRDGFGSLTGIAVIKPADWTGGDVTRGWLMCVTGILRAVPNLAGLPVRVLVPRGMSDVVVVAGH